MSDDESQACDVAHGHGQIRTGGGQLVCVFDTEVAAHLLAIGQSLGYQTGLLEPDRDREGAGASLHADVVSGSLDQFALGDSSDIVVTDHHRGEVGECLRDALASPAGWIGIMGSPRHHGPHVKALRDLGVSDDDIARVRRPIGLNIGSKTPAEIALATAAGLVAEHNSAPGGFDFSPS